MLCSSTKAGGSNSLMRWLSYVLNYLQRLQCGCVTEPAELAAGNTGLECIVPTGFYEQRTAQGESKMCCVVIKVHRMCATFNVCRVPSTWQ